MAVAGGGGGLGGGVNEGFFSVSFAGRREIEKLNIAAPRVCNLITQAFLLPSLFLWLAFTTDSQPEPQRHLPNQFPGRVQVDGGAHSLPEAGQVPGGHHLH